MDLQLSPEQQMLRDAVRDLCRTHGDPERIRALEDDPVGFDPAAWQSLVGMDLAGLTLPVEHGGSGMSALEAMVVFEELGRAIVPTPLLVSSLVGGGLLAAVGSPDLQAAWLPRVANGEAILTLAWHEAGRSDREEGVALSAVADGDALVLSGTKILVPYASSADAMVVLVREEAGVSLVLVETDADGITLQQTTVADSSAQYEVRLDGVRVPAANRLGDPGTGWETFVDVMDDALIAVAAQAVGGTAHVLEMMVDYACERVQFGVPIGNFQGVAHPIADVATELEGARTLVLQAAWARAEHGTGGALPALAKRFACETYRRATRCAHQVYGGIGFTRAIDVQLYFRRAKQIELDWFEPRTLADRIAVAELDDEQPLVGLDAGI
jgi:alkylation response protein AidB-like acyl-CoA dehydrogenase